MQHDAGIAIAIGYARSAAIANRRRLPKLPYRTDGFVPRIAAPHIEVPIHVETFVSAITNEALRLTTQMLLHVGDRSSRIIDGKQVAQIINRVEGFDQFGGFEVDQTRVRRPGEGRRSQTRLLR